MNKEKIESGFRMVLEGLGVDLNDPHFEETPARIAKAWVEEICMGLNDKNFKVTTFPVEKNYQSSMVVLQHIPVKSVCAHHLLSLHWGSHRGLCATQNIVWTLQTLPGGQPLCPQTSGARKFNQRYRPISRPNPLTTRSRCDYQGIPPLYGNARR